MVRFGYCITYVENVGECLAFFENAFGLIRRFLHDSGTYGELDTGATTLAFAAMELGQAHFPDGFERCDGARPLGMEVALVCDDVAAAHQSALDAGATELCKAEEKPWGQIVSYVRAPSGVLVELCSPM